MSDTDLHGLLVQISNQVDAVDLIPQVRRGVQVKTQRRIAVVAAGTALAVAAIIYGAVHLASGNPHLTPAHHPHTHTSPTSRATQHIGPTTLSMTRTVKTLVSTTGGEGGPAYPGFDAFGSFWATGGGHSPTSGILYRISTDGRRILTQAAYPSLSPDQPDPVRIGDSVVVADGTDDFYTVFNANAHKIGTLPNHANGAMAGDSSGGWVSTTGSQIAHIGPTGLRVVKSLSLSVRSIDGLAMSPKTLWVIDADNNQLVRVSASTGAVTGRLQLPSSPIQVAYTAGAVYVTSDDDGLRRVDPATMTVTAVTFSSKADGSPVVASSPSDQLWVQGSEGTLAQLNPRSLTTERNIAVFAAGVGGQSTGALVTRHLVLVGDSDEENLHVFGLT